MPVSGNSSIPRRNEHLRIFSNSWEEPVTGIDISKTGKDGGFHRNWLNIEYTSTNTLFGQRGPIDFKKRCFTLRKTKSVIITGVPDVTGDEYAEAKRQDFLSWQTNQVFHAVDNVGQTSIETRWVLTTKPDRSGKARLFAKIFQDPNRDLMVKSSPTC